MKTKVKFISDYNYNSFDYKRAKRIINKINKLLKSGHIKIQQGDVFMIQNQKEK